MWDGSDRSARLRVLYVGSDPPDERALASAFDDVELHLETVAGTGPARERLDDADCIVSEQDLPDGSGLGLLETVRERDADVPFVLYPGDGSEALAGEAIGAGVSEYVPRREDRDHLARRVAAAVRRSAVADGGLVSPDRQLGETVKERAMDEAPVGITLADPSLPDTPLVYVNDRFVEVTGYERDEVLGRNCRFLQGPESGPEQIQAMREAIDAEEQVSVELVNYAKSGERFWNKVDIAPIRDDDGDVSHFVGFQTDITKRKEAELELERERANLEHLLDRVEGLLQDVTASLMRATDREELETALVERLAATDPYVGAWVARPDLGGGSLRPGERAGRVTDIERTVALDSADPVARAFETGEMCVTGLDVEGTGVHADLFCDRGSLAAVPLSYRETDYGVLVVYTDGPSERAFNEREQVVLSALARAAATALNAIEGRRMLAADQVAELELTVTDPDVAFVAISGWADCELEYHGSVYRDDGSLLLFFTVAGAPAEDVLTVARACEDVVAAEQLTEREEGSLFEFAVGADAFVPALAERGVETREIHATGGRARVEVDVAPGESREVVEWLQARHPGTELAAYHERQRPARTRQEFTDAITERLTGQQLTALRKAYLGGYFDPTRQITGDELAGSMDISRSTFHQHLRAALRKLTGEFFDPGEQQ